jgi:hypothetical protein
MPIHLLHLPRELRDMIYKQVLISSTGQLAPIRIPTVPEESCFNPLPHILLWPPLMSASAAVGRRNMSSRSPSCEHVGRSTMRPGTFSGPTIPSPSPSICLDLTAKNWTPGIWGDIPWVEGKQVLELVGNGALRSVCLNLDADFYAHCVEEYERAYEGCLHYQNPAVFRSDQRDTRLVGWEAASAGTAWSGRILNMLENLTHVHEAATG